MLWISDWWSGDAKDSKRAAAESSTVFSIRTVVGETKQSLVSNIAAIPQCALVILFKCVQKQVLILVHGHINGASVDRCEG